MRRFFVNEELVAGKKYSITGRDAAHIGKVLRMQPGEAILLVDRQGKAWQSRLAALSPQRVDVVIEVPWEALAEPPLKVILVQGLPKGDKFDLIIEKSAELGVSVILPVRTRRTVVNLEAAKAQKRLERWQRIAEEAAKQSGRTTVPRVEPLGDFAQAVRDLPPHGLALIPWEGEKQRSLKEVITQSKGPNNPIIVFIGPEGGWDEEEVVLAQKRGAIPVSLGPRILRTETAGLAVLTILMYQLGDLGGTIIGS
ncbi:MAG: 16S rRNA (uracil(1498)-N(3))-methyltransferase [Bacillota bacterium]